MPQSQHLLTKGHVHAFISLRVLSSRLFRFGRDRVDFLHSSWYEAMLWICAENSAASSGIVQCLLLLSRAYRA